MQNLIVHARVEEWLMIYLQAHELVTENIS